MRLSPMQQGRTALHLAMSTFNRGLIEMLLLAPGADVTLGARTTQGPKVHYPVLVWMTGTERCSYCVCCFNFPCTDVKLMNACILLWKRASCSCLERCTPFCCMLGTTESAVAHMLGVFDVDRTYWKADMDHELHAFCSHALAPSAGCCTYFAIQQAGSTPLHIAPDSDDAEPLILAGADVNAADEVRGLGWCGEVWAGVGRFREVWGVMGRWGLVWEHGHKYHVLSCCCATACAIPVRSKLCNIKTLQDGNTPLHTAEVTVHHCKMTLLLRSGADVNARNKASAVPPYIVMYTCMP